MGAGLLLAAGGALWWGLGRPQRKVEQARIDEPKMVRLMEESIALEKEFARIRDNRTPSAADLRQLQRAIDFQNEWMQATGSDTPEQRQRLQDLQAMYDAAWVRSSIAVSAEAEATGRAHLAAGRAEEAVAELRRALTSQQELNRRRSGEGRDLPRETLLAQEVDRLEALPIADELARRTTQGGRLRDEGRSEAALEAYQHAHELQLRLNREYGRTEFASLRNLENLGAEIATLESLPLYRRVQELSEQAAEAAANGAHEQAADRFEQAAAAQQQLNAEFPRSRHASAERFDTLETARQTQTSAPAVAELARMDAEVGALLRRRELAEVPDILLRGARLQDALFTRYPRSRLLDAELRLKFNYLLLNREALGPVLDLLADRFRPVPGRGVQMLDTEVPQQLYRLVMAANPSRQAGDALPVESVNGSDADEFCRRLSWMLGRKVRLPREEEYRAALGEVPSGPDAGAQVWSQERSDGHPRAAAAGVPNGAGFADLLGNVAEWLAPDTATAGSAKVAGGSYADPAAVLAAVPMVPTPRGERARTIGFRVVRE